MPDSTEHAADQLTAALDEIREYCADGTFSNFYVTMRAAAAPRLLAAIDAVLGMHAQTAYTAYIEPCTAHLGDIPGQRGCPDCRPVQRTGCRRCRDENGHPARPEECGERQAIIHELLGEGRTNG